MISLFFLSYLQFHTFIETSTSSKWILFYKLTFLPIENKKLEIYYRFFILFAFILTNILYLRFIVTLT